MTGRAVAAAAGLGALAATPTAYLAGYPLLCYGLLLAGAGLCILAAVPAGSRP